jgi:hypothetical protein
MPFRRAAVAKPSLPLHNKACPPPFPPPLPAGEACLRFGTLIPRPSCLYINANMAGAIAEAVANWPQQGVRVVVVTDGAAPCGEARLGQGAGARVGVAPQASGAARCPGHPAGCPGQRAFCAAPGFPPADGARPRPTPRPPPAWPQGSASSG